MPIDPSAVGASGDPVKRSWNSKDGLLYALGVGASLDDLKFTTENTKDTPQQILPTFAVIIGGGGAPFNKIGSFNPAMLVHGEQTIELFDEIPPEGEIESTGRISAIWDKGKGAVVEMTSESTLVATGKPLLKTVMSAFIRGEGDFGGERGPSASFEAPSREPDHQVSYATRDDQALLYRLSGDRNPLHSDPEFARKAGFDKPILHGMCTYGITCRAVLSTFADWDPTAFRRHAAQFRSPVFPGETITVDMWKDGGTISFEAHVKARGVTVVKHGLSELG